MICNGLTRQQSNALYLEVLEAKDNEALRRLCKEDLFFLLTVALKRRDIDRDWLYERIREVEANPDGFLDLWAREHYKSTIGTFGMNIQGGLKDPEKTTGIFSHTRPIAKAFLEQIKRELELNTFLQNLFPDVLYKNPQSEAPKWSLDSGLILKRKTNPKEATYEAWGLVDGQPTGKHFDVLDYDDVVTRESVTTPEQIKKTTEAIEMSYNLGSRGGVKRAKGTRYHVNDTYKVLMDRGTFKPRIYTATDDGTPNGIPVLMTPEQLSEKRRDMGPYTFGTQMLQDPVSDKAMGFKPDWLKYVDKVNYKGWNIYILVDPSGSKKKLSGDYTVIVIIGLAPDGNYYRIDAIRDRLNLTERTKKLFEFHRKYNPQAVGYESYGMQADIEHIKYVQEQENYRFRIIELGGSMPKPDRIRRLIPIYEQHRFYSPKTINFVNHEGKSINYVEAFTNEEYSIYPVVSHDDMLDCESRILDPEFGAKFPKETKPINLSISNAGPQGWMG